MTDEADEKAAQAHKEARHNRIAKFLWLLLLIPVTVAYVFLDFETFVKVTSLLTVYLSVTAMSVGHHAAQKAAESTAAGYENP